MNLKRTKILSTILIFMLCFLFHFLYEWIPNSITAIFFPVNESIWEHMKMLFSSIIFYGIIDYLILTKKNIKFNNFFTSLFSSAFLSIPIYLLLYLPLYYKIGPKMTLNIIILFITILISQVISYYIQKRNNIKYLNIISLVLIIVSYITFGILTYFPITTELFFDPMSEKYGINTFVISQDPNQ